MDHSVIWGCWGVNNVLLHKACLGQTDYLALVLQAELRAQMYKRVYLRINSGSLKHLITVYLIALHDLNSNRLLTIKSMVLIYSSTVPLSEE